MSLNSSSILHINTKFEAYRLIHDPTQLFSLLYSKYGDIEEDLYLQYINQLIYNIPTKFNCKFKEIKYNDIFFDYLKRIYHKKESINRIPKLSNYYKNYYLFFCRPTFRNRILGKLILNYEDNKAQIFYKNNYQESKNKKVSEKSISKGKNNNKSKSNKKSISFSFSSLDNITNNKIIFDKETRKILDRNETEYNNFYNTLNLETSKSSIVINNNNCLLSKRSLNDSFEKCIYAIVNYQNKKNKNNIKNKNEQKPENKNYKRKNVIINNINSNLFKYKKCKKKIKKQSENQNNSNINNNQKKYSIFIDKKLKNLGIKKITRVNSNFNNNNILLSSKNRKNSLFSLSNNNYLSNRINILSNSIINLKSNKKEKNKDRLINIKDIKLEELNLNKILNNNKILYNFKKPLGNTKNKTYIFSNNNILNNTSINKNNNYSNIYSKLNLNIHSNIDIMQNLNLDNENKYKKLSKLTEYLNQTKSNDKKNMKNDFIHKKLMYKKYNLSMGDGGEDNKNIFFNFKNNINSTKGIAKKKVKINKNLKIAIANINNTNNNISYNNSKLNSNKIRHIKNKTFDYNSTNYQNINNSKQNSNLTNLNIDEFNTIFNKPKKIIYKINGDNNIKNNKILLSNENIYKNKKSKKKNPIISPTSHKIYNKIPFELTSSKGKNNHKKNIIVKILSPNSKNTENEFKEFNSPLHKKNNYSMLTKEDLFNNNYISKISKLPMNKKDKLGKNNFFSNNNNINNTNLVHKNISSLLSPLHNTNLNTSKIKNRINFNILAKFKIFKINSINKNKKIKNYKKEKNLLINSNSMRKSKALYSDIYLTNYNTNINNNSNNLTENNKKISRNRKNTNIQNNSMNSQSNYNKTKNNKNDNKSNCNIKNKKIKKICGINNNITSNSNSTNHTIFNHLNKNISLNNDNSLKKNIINNHPNINISIGDNNINIKDSILHINKIYIKSNNINNIYNKNIIFKIEKRNFNVSKDKILKEKKIDNSHIKTEGNIIRKNKEKIKSVNYPKGKNNFSPTNYKSNNIVGSKNKK